MALVFGTFQWLPWLVYVLVTVLYEAAVLTRFSRAGWWRSLSVSVGANFATGIFGTAFSSGIFGYVIYSVGAKNRCEPNPLVHAVVSLTVGGVLSALIEAPLWKSLANRPAWKASLLTHLVGVPVALAILLFPDRPYEGLESQAHFRRQYARKDAVRGLNEALGQAEERGKPFLAPRDWIALLAVAKLDGADLRAAGFQPHFGRFDTGEAGREPAEWNPALVGKDLLKLERPVWLVRWGASRYPEGIVWEGGFKYVPNLRGWEENRRRDPSGEAR